MAFLKEVLVCIFLCVSCTSAASLPSGLTKCDLDDPNYSTCLPKAIQTGILFYKDGDKKFGIPTVEPMTVDALTVGAGQGAVNVVQNYKNLKIAGASKVHVLSAGYNAQENILFAKMILPELVAEGDYDMEGRILVLPMKGKGKFKITMHECVLDHTVKFKDIEKNGKTYMQIEKYDLKMTPEKVDFYFGNLFDGNKQLSDTLLTTLNDNWREVFEDVKSGYEEAFAEIFKNVAQRFFRKVPKVEIFS